MPIFSQMESPAPCRAVLRSKCRDFSGDFSPSLSDPELSLLMEAPGSQPWLHTRSGWGALHNPPATPPHPRPGLPSPSESEAVGLSYGPALEFSALPRPQEIRMCSQDGEPLLEPLSHAVGLPPTSESQGALQQQGPTVPS